jgi:hypothetical protein
MTQNANEDFVDWESLSREEQLQAEKLLKEFDEVFNSKKDEEPCTDLNSTEK